MQNLFHLTIAGLFFRTSDLTPLSENCRIILWWSQCHKKHKFLIMSALVNTVNNTQWAVMFKCLHWIITCAATVTYFSGVIDLYFLEHKRRRKKNEHSSNERVNSTTYHQTFNKHFREGYQSGWACLLTFTLLLAEKEWAYDRVKCRNYGPIYSIFKTQTAI